jgi:hypothetical protein
VDDDGLRNTDISKAENLTQGKKSIEAENLAEWREVIDDKTPDFGNILKEESMTPRETVKNKPDDENKLENEIHVIPTLDEKNMTEKNIDSKVDQDVFETTQKAKASDTMERKDNTMKDNTIDGNPSQNKVHFETNYREKGQTNEFLKASASTQRDSSSIPEPKSRKLPGQPVDGDIPSSTLKTPVYTYVSKQKVSAQKFPCLLPKKTKTKVILFSYYSYLILSVFI